MLLLVETNQMFCSKKKFILFCALSLISTLTYIKCDEIYDFPANFSFGVSTAAYQIEGGWNEDGKGPSIWDHLVHTHPELIADHSNADVGADSYHKFDKDLEALKYLGVNHYRLSISWPRILPTGDVSSFNSAGIKYYNDVINQLLANGIEPMLTMFHYDLPHELQKIGGFTNPLFVKYFEAYARILFTHFGDRVKHWVTFNEPYDYCVPGYGQGTYPPLIDASGVADYLCIHHTIKAHAVAYHLYRNEFYEKFKGKIGITTSSRFYMAKNQNDQYWADRAMKFSAGWLLDPICTNEGDYPQIMIDVIGNNSKNEGRVWSRLPEFDDNWKKVIRKTTDFIGLNYYTSRFVTKRTEPPTNTPSWEYDVMTDGIVDPSWKRGKSSWLYSVPEGFGKLLRWLWDEYDHTEIIVTENGWSDDGQLNDDDRIEYISQHVAQVLKANKDGVNVSGYTIWSLIDNFEWLKGYTERFGLYYINFTSPNKERIPKKSAEFVKNLIKNRQVILHQNDGNEV